MQAAKNVRKQAEETTAAYHAHRGRQRRRILDAAWKLLDERGIDRVTMAELIAASGVQPSTMYQYFSNKDEIVWAILGDLMLETSERARQALEGATTAMERLTALLNFMADDLENELTNVRFMAQFDAMYARHWPAEQLITLESRIDARGFRVFHELIREGIADGSLRPDLDPGLTMHAVINAVIGAQRRLASLGEKIEKEYGKPIDRMFRETIRILLLGLKAPETKARPRTARKSGAARARKRS